MVANGDGPTLLALGGTHGDEFEGPVALMKLARALQPRLFVGGSFSSRAELPAVRAGRAFRPRTG